MSVTDLLTTYWPQVTTLLTGAGVLIGWQLNIRGERIKTRDALFQEKKLNALEDFFAATAKLERMWRDLPVISILNDKYTPAEIRKMILDDLRELKQKIYIVSLYISPEELRLFEEVNDKMNNINSGLNLVYFNRKVANGFILESDFEFCKHRNLTDTYDLLQQISQQVRLSYKSK